MPLLDLYPWSTALTLSTVAFLFTVTWRRPLIGLLKRWGIGKQIRVDGPQSHQVKMGTTTFEMLGWSETHITQRFWMVNLLSAMLGIALALL